MATWLDDQHGAMPDWCTRLYVKNTFLSFGWDGVGPKRQSSAPPSPISQVEVERSETWLAAPQWVAWRRTLLRGRRSSRSARRGGHSGGCTSRVRSRGDPRSRSLSCASSRSSSCRSDRRCGFRSIGGSRGVSCRSSSSGSSVRTSSAEHALEQAVLDFEPLEMIAEEATVTGLGMEPLRATLRSEVVPVHAVQLSNRFLTLEREAPACEISQVELVGPIESTGTPLGSSPAGDAGVEDAAHSIDVALTAGTARRREHRKVAARGAHHTDDQGIADTAKKPKSQRSGRKKRRNDTQRQVLDNCVNCAASSPAPSENGNKMELTVEQPAPPQQEANGCTFDSDTTEAIAACAIQKVRALALQLRGDLRAVPLDDPAQKVRVKEDFGKQAKGLPGPLPESKAHTLALVAARLNELAIKAHLRSAGTCDAFFVFPVDPPSFFDNSETGDMLQLELGTTVQCDIVDLKSGWGFGAVVAPERLAGRKGCFRCEIARPVRVQARQSSIAGNMLQFDVVTWQDVAHTTPTNTQQRLRHKAMMNRIHAARALWEVRKCAAK